MDTRWLDDDEQKAFLGLVAVAELLPGALDAQLRRDSGLTHFEYLVLAMLSESPERTLRMTSLAQRTNATLTRLSRTTRWTTRRNNRLAPRHRSGWAGCCFCWRAQSC